MKEKHVLVPSDNRGCRARLGDHRGLHRLATRLLPSNVIKHEHIDAIAATAAALPRYLRSEGTPPLRGRTGAASGVDRAKGVPRRVAAPGPVGPRGTPFARLAAGAGRGDQSGDRTVRMSRSLFLPEASPHTPKGAPLATGFFIHCKRRDLRPPNRTPGRPRSRHRAAISFRTRRDRGR